MNQKELLAALADAVLALLEDAANGNGSKLSMTRINILRSRIRDAKSPAA